MLAVKLLWFIAMGLCTAGTPPGGSAAGRQFYGYLLGRNWLQPVFSWCHQTVMLVLLNCATIVAHTSGSACEYAHYMWYNAADS